MTSQSVLPRRDGTAIPEPRHQHSSACYWSTKDCRWQCVAYPLVGYALEHCTALARPVLHAGPETRP